MDPRLTNNSPNEHITALETFAQRVRNGEFSRCAGVRVQTVQVALCAVGATFELDGRDNPCYKRFQQVYHKCLKRLIDGYKRQDPPTERKLAVPVTVIHEILQQTLHNFTPHRGQIANLCIVAFYFLLRSCEYCDTAKETRTQKFTLGDITFWQGTQ